jgi:fusion protein PurCD
MNVLLLGNGAREHILAEKIKESQHNVNLFVYASAKNPGIYKQAEKYEIGDICNTESVCIFAKSNNIDFVVIGPEQPLAVGMTDALKGIGIPSLAPTKQLAQLETSKGFTRDLLEKYNIIGNPDFRVFKISDPDVMHSMTEYLYSLGDDYVVKYDALLGGKGVKISGEHLENRQDALAYALECLEECGRVVIEEKLVGEEFSLISLVDGETVQDFPVAQDHKRAYEGDTGPNTGGMGTYSDRNHLLPFVTQKDKDEAHTITLAVMKALEKECGEIYKGIMYGGFIITKKGVRLIEYNARFGDPEVMNLLALLETDFIDLCLATIEGTLKNIQLTCKNLASVCKYVVPEGYPENSLKNEKIILTQELRTLDNHSSDLKMYYAAIDQKDSDLIMTGSRAIAFVGLGDSIAKAEKLAQQGVESVKGKVFFRKDIATEALIQKRIDHMKGIRSE